nr:hypothetical protein [Tanacetum cinerariifolium]
EPVNPKPALVIHHHAPAPPEGYSDDDDIKDDEEDSDEDPEEEPIKQDDDKEVEEDGVDDVDDEEMKGSSAGALLAGNSEVNAPGPIALRKNSSEHFEMKKFVLDLSRQFNELKEHNLVVIPLYEYSPTFSLCHDSIMPLRKRSQTNPQPLLTQEAINQLVQDRIEAAIRAERERVREEATRTGGPVGGPATAPVATLGLKVTNGKPWAEVKKMMIDEFNELALLCPDAVPNEKKKAKLYIKGLPEVIKGEITSSRPDMLNDAMRMVHTLIEQKIQAKNERVAEGNKKRWENNNQGGNYNRNNRGNYHDNNRHSQYNQRRQDGAKAMIAA